MTADFTSPYFHTTQPQQSQINSYSIKRGYKRWFSIIFLKLSAFVSTTLELIEDAGVNDVNNMPSSQFHSEQIVGNFRWAFHFRNR